MYSIKNIRFQQILFGIAISTGIAIIGLILNGTGALTVSGVFIVLTGITGFLVGKSIHYLKKTPAKARHNSFDIESEFLLHELENLKKENIKVTTEVNFLKNQFNSHILFNFLNFCYSKIHKSSESAAEAIESFSEMLRYSSKMKVDEPVLLKKEIEYIENYIIIQKCLTEKVCIDFKYEGDISKKKILPGILVSFIENAFKYGEINNERHPIDVHLVATEDRIVFKVKNKKNMVNRIDLLDSRHQAIKRILNTLYGSQHQLKIKDVGEEYQSELALNMHFKE